jgi:cell division protein FtsL
MTYSAATAGAQRRPAFGRNQNTTYFKSSKSNIGPVTNIIILTVIVCMMGLIYLTQVTKTYALGYRVDELSKKQDQLTTEHANLELESVKLRSIEKVKTSQASAAMVSVSPTTYAQ